MYAEYFGLNEKPFSIAPDPHYLYMSESHQEALAHLLYGLQTEGGFVLLTGEIGTGKTTLCKCMFEQAPPEINFAYIVNPKITALELLESVCDELLIEKPDQTSKKQMIDCINRYLLQINGQGKKTVIVIDEAQNLTGDVLEQLRLLTNLETSRHKLLQIILLGQPELRELIRKPEMRQLSQRITARYHLGSLSKENSALYISHRISVAGSEKKLFADGAIQLIYKLTGGVPRLLNLLCDRALLGAYTEQEEQVTRRIVKQASKETFDLQLQDHRSRRLFAAIFLIAIATVSTILIFPAVETDHSLPQRATTEELTTTPTSPEMEPVELPGTVIEKNFDSETLPAIWPDNLGFGNNFNTVFIDLAALWLLNYTDSNSEPCRFAQDSALECLNKKGSLESVLNLNLPAVLTLYDDAGLPFYALLSALNGRRAVFIVANQQTELDVAVLENRWFGEYFLLWKSPPGFSKPLYPGQQSPMVNWLATALQLHGLYQVNGMEKKLEGTLLGALKRFQFSSNLVPDGVLGTQTIIRLNSSIATSDPRLYTGEAD